MLNVGQERLSPIDIDTSGELRAVAVAPNGEYLVSGGTSESGVRLWRMQDGQPIASLGMQYVRSLAVSKDGRWIAAGTWKEVVVWDAATHERVFVHEERSVAYFDGVDFSPDSTRLVTGSFNKTASIWDIATRQRVVGPLLHKDVVVAAKYAPDGTRIATATPSGSVRVYDSNDGRLLFDIPVKVSPWFNTGLLWSNKRLFVVSDVTIKQIDAYTGSEISEWPVPDSNTTSCCIALPQHGEYIAYATYQSVTVWDTSTHSQLGVIQHPQNIHSMVLSPDDRFLVIAGENGKVTINNLARVNDSIPLPRLHPTFREPDIRIDDAVLDAWKSDQLESVEAVLTTTISTTPDLDHYALATRALVRTRLQNWDTALADAEQSIKLEPSVIGYIAKSLAHVGKGEKYDGYRACDIAFERFHSTHVSFILLIKAIIAFIAGDKVDAISRVDDLITTVHFNSICYVVQAYMYFLIGNWHMDRRDYERAIENFERARTQMRYHQSRTLFVISLISGWKFDDLGIVIQKRLCEALYASGRTKEAAEALLSMVSAVDEEVSMSAPIATWVSDFMQQCLSTPQSSRDAPSSSTLLLREWAKLKLTSGSWKDALSVGGKFTASKSAVYRAICEQLEILDQLTDVTECFHQMMRELGGENMPSDQAEWILDSIQRFSKKLECRGDAAAEAQQHKEAIFDYSAALSLGPASPQRLFIKRSKAYMAKNLWKDALNDANAAIKHDPSSPWGYERKHAALHKTGDYDKAISAFKTMLSEMAHSPDPEIRKRREDYVSPEQTEAAIRKAVQDAIRDTPRVLINTHTGHLVDKSKQGSMFEKLPVYKEMISSMTTEINGARIEQEVTQYYRYATFSHKWEENEPLFDKVVNVIVYDLEDSSTHDKLQMFCKIVRDAGFQWAWSDTCCINKADHVVLQEALVAMFKWYEGSSVTIVYLRDIRSPSRRGDLTRSIWNKRAWTFQEYHASKVVRFYTEDWKPYLNLDIPNHKDSPEIISEMEGATGVSAQILMALRPGLDDIREKLCLASLRETTLVEDAAYSLLGVFSTSLSIVYGEGGDRALGRLLSHLLTSSEDTSILAWTGRSGAYNSCLPAHITVFHKLPTSHIPPAVSDSELESAVTQLRASSLDFAEAQRLYERLSDLSVPMFAGKRMKLPCIMFRLGPLSSPSRTRIGSERVYRAQATALGVVEIRTKEDLSRLESLCLVHPWIDFLLHRQSVGSGSAVVSEGSTDESTDDLSLAVNEMPPTPGPASIPPTIKRTRTLQFAARLGLLSSGRSATFPRDTASLLPPVSVSQVDKRTRTLQFVARLRQPFGALLFTQTRQNVAEYRRVASESTITVQVREDASLSVLIDNVRLLDVL